MKLMSSGRVGISFPKGKCIVFCVCADGKPAHVGDFSLWNLHLASKLFDFFRIFAHRFNTDVVCDGLLWLLPFHYSAAYDLLSIFIASPKHPVFHRTRHFFCLPTKYTVVEFVCTFYVVRRYFKMNYCSHSNYLCIATIER